jgi:hypothetical protein
MRPPMERDAARMPPTGGGIAIRIDYLSRGIAGVQCFCHCHVDLLHLIDMQDGWKIVNAAWRLR